MREKNMPLSKQCSLACTLCLVAFLSCVVWSGSVFAQKELPATSSVSLGSLLPGKTLGAVVLTNPSKLNEKVKKLSRELGIPPQDALLLGRAFSGANNGLDDQRPLLVVAYQGAAATSLLPCANQW